MDRIRTTHIQIHGIDGGNIVGYYIDGEGDSHGFVAVIPEPATLSLVTMRGLMLLHR